MKSLIPLPILLFYCLSAFAQIQGASGIATPLPDPGPQVYTDKKAEPTGKAPEIMTAEESVTALFHERDLFDAYQILSRSKTEFSKWDALFLMEFCRVKLFADPGYLLANGAIPCRNDAELYPDGIIPKVERNVSYRNLLEGELGKTLLEEFQFCLQYIGVSYLDRSLWDHYVQKERNWIANIKNSNFPERLKGFLLANDLFLKVCQQKLPFSSENKP